MDYEKRIRNLERKYSETNISKGEVLSDETISRINKTYNQNQQKRRVDAILNNVKNKDSIKKEVHDIIKNTHLKSLCWNCKEETIIAIIILYCQRTRNSKYQIDRTGLWRKYNVSWSKYSVIVERLLAETRSRTIVKPEVVDANLDHIRW